MSAWVAGFLASVMCFAPGWALDNGLALTPPMGWLTWERFRCNTNCTLHPGDCLSEKLMKQMADKMVEDGYLAAGYQYLIIDDCWPELNRDSNGDLVPDKLRFPNGLKKLSNYIHNKGLKFGLYEDYGTQTCGGYPGVIDHMKQDAERFASWEVDYVKLDGCYADSWTMDEGYVQFGKFLEETKRPMVYSCSWPVYQDYNGIAPNFTLIMKHCNLWRNYDDIDDSWSSVRDIMDYFASQQEHIAQFAGPGHWNDPDMLIIGNYGLSYEQAKAQMAIWCILAAPLIMSNDLRNTKPEFREILLNKDAISINQHPAGVQGKRRFKMNNIEFWTKPLDPMAPNADVWAVAVTSKRVDGVRYRMSVPLERIGIDPAGTYTFTEVFKAMDPFEIQPNGNLTVRVPPLGVLFFKVKAH